MMENTIGTPLTSKATKALLLGSGELGKEVAIELQRLGVEVIAVDCYANAPAMQVAHRSYVFSMLDAQTLRTIALQEKPDFIIPEIEAIATDVLAEVESLGIRVVPNANATRLTMNREGIRTLTAEKLGLRTSPYSFAGSLEELSNAISQIGFPCVVKPVMSSSGKGQSVVRNEAQIAQAWNYACQGGRGKSDRIIVEGFVDFDYEITLLTISHKGGISFCAPIGHRQEDGDYRESWQPQLMNPTALAAAQEMASKVVQELGGWGLFGVEFFIKGDMVWFSELSPRPHDTGMVTLISQNLSEFALHVRAILGHPIPNITLYGPAASSVILVEGESSEVSYSGLQEALADTDTQVRLFGKPNVKGKRRMGVALALGANVEAAKAKAIKASNAIKVTL
jgi:phosphoribosylglycinamide formyltransferase 2